MWESLLFLLCESVFILVTDCLYAHVVFGYAVLRDLTFLGSWRTEGN